MKENIESKYVGNRKMIIELRLKAKPIIIDRIGELAERMENEKVFSNTSWEINNNVLAIRNNTIMEDASDFFSISFNKIHYISDRIDSVEAFYGKFKKIYDIVRSVINDITIYRIGCRIIGSYKTKQNDYTKILDNIKALFPTSFLLSNYPMKDMLFRVNYENGMYQIGPVNRDDDFFHREFPDTKIENHVGFAIDTDNYLTNEVQSIDKPELIKDIFELSLSVEKDLFDNLYKLNS